MDKHLYERAWAAGFFDGEGHFGFRLAYKDGKPRRRILASITQNDREVLDRFQQAVDVGGVYEERHRERGVFVYRTSSLSGVKQVLAQLTPWLGSIKTRQGTLALERWHELDSQTRPQVPVALHGTVSRYSSKKHKCRCDACRAAYARYHQERRKRMQ